MTIITVASKAESSGLFLLFPPFLLWQSPLFRFWSLREANLMQRAHLEFEKPGLRFEFEFRGKGDMDSRQKGD